MDRLAQRFERVLSAMARTSDPLGDPLALDFEPCTGQWHAEQWQRFAQGAPAAGLVLYLHLPYCAKICSYCLLSAERPDGAGAIERYVEAMVRELARHGEILAGLPLTRLHVGGGTPTLLSAVALRRLLGAARTAFGPSPGSVEAHPSTTTREKLEVMLAQGVERVSLGVESLTPQVLARVNRADQTFARVVSAVRAAHELGMSVNVDLLAGLPGETAESFERSLQQTLELPIDALSVNRFLAEGSPLGRSGYSPSPDDVRAASEMLERTDAIVRSARPPDFPEAAPADARYGVQYLWQRAALEGGYSQQDMIDPGSVLAVGAGRAITTSRTAARRSGPRRCSRAICQSSGCVAPTPASSRRFTSRIGSAEARSAIARRRKRSAPSSTISRAPACSRTGDCRWAPRSALPT